MKQKISALLLIAGFVILVGLAGSEDLAVALGQAGRSIGELILWGLAGLLMLAGGVRGLNGEVRR